MPAVRPCVPDELEAIARVINDGALAYRGIVPERFLHDPYMTLSELAVEMSTVTFCGYEERGTLVGVMGVDHVVRGVTAVRQIAGATQVLAGHGLHGVDPPCPGDAGARRLTLMTSGRPEL